MKLWQQVAKFSQEDRQTAPRLTATEVFLLKNNANIFG